VQEQPAKVGELLQSFLREASAGDRKL